MRMINPKSLAAPRGYNNGTLAPQGSLLFIAGQVGWDENGEVVSDRFVEQFDQALANVLAVVTEAGGWAHSIGKLTIYVTDVREYLAARREIGDAYRRRMGKHYPAMTLVEVKGLLEPGARVEIEGYAVV